MPTNRLNSSPSQNSQVSSEQGHATDAQIARIDALTLTGRTNWFALLAYLAFVTVTTLGVEDLDFFIETRQTELPIVGVSIPTFSFFIFAPLLGAALYVHFHLHIRKVTEALGKPPLGPPPQLDGDTLETRIKPWLLNDFILRQRRDGAVTDRPLDLLSWLTTCLLVWLAGPIVLGLMWYRSWPAHSLTLSSISAFCMMATCYVGNLSWTKMRCDIGRRHSNGVVLAIAVSTLLFVPVTWLTLANSKGIAQLVIDYDPNLDDASRTWLEQREAWVREKKEATERTHFESLAVMSWDMVTGLAKIRAPDLSAVQLSMLPPEHTDLKTSRHRYRAQWCQRNGFSSEICGGSKSASVEENEVLWRARENWCFKAGFKNCQAHFTNLEDDFEKREWPWFRTATIFALEKPDLSGRDLRAARFFAAHLSGIDLSEARLEGANLNLAKLERANLDLAQLAGANLSEARLENASMFQAQLQGADLKKAQLEGANLDEAWLVHADLSEAEMNETRLDRVRLTGAQLRFAQLQKASLVEAHLESADLYAAQLEGAVLREATMMGTNLALAQLKGADLRFAELKHADLRLARLEEANLSQSDLQNAILVGANLTGAEISRAYLTGADFRLARLSGTAYRAMLLAETDMRSIKIDGAALRYVDFRNAVIGTRSGFVNSFGDATALLPDNFERPCQWASERLSDREFFARWRGWSELSPYTSPSWEYIAPIGWKNIKPVPPPAGCTWHE